MGGVWILDRGSGDSSANTTGSSLYREVRTLNVTANVAEPLTTTDPIVDMEFFFDNKLEYPVVERISDTERGITHTATGEALVILTLDGSASGNTGGNTGSGTTTTIPIQDVSVNLLENTQVPVIASGTIKGVVSVKVGGEIIYPIIEDGATPNEVLITHTDSVAAVVTLIIE